jgi:hypothetical protein
MTAVQTLALVGQRPRVRHLVTIRRRGVAGDIAVESACGISWRWYAALAHHHIKPPIDADGVPRGRLCLRCARSLEQS